MFSQRSSISGQNQVRKFLEHTILQRLPPDTTFLVAFPDLAGPRDKLMGPRLLLVELGSWLAV
jgi:hypothetical protein